MNGLNERIIVKCRHAGFEIARVNAMPNGIVIERGHLRNNFFVAVESELLRYDEHPEMEGIYAGGAWDTEELAALVNDCCEEVEA